MANMKLPSGYVVLDAPGITGAGTLSRLRLSAYTAAGGPCFHPQEPDSAHRAAVDRANQAARSVVIECASAGSA